MWPFKNKALSDFDHEHTRDELIRRGRILVIDDEDPEIVAELKKKRFAVDHDKNGDDLAGIESHHYDVVLLDYSDVGKKYGGTGLGILHHIKRVSPMTFVIAYTSRALVAKVSDFYRLADDVLEKDTGLDESLACIENGLSRSLKKERLFSGIMEIAGLKNNQATVEELRETLLKALAKRNKELFVKRLSAFVKWGTSKGIDVALGKLFPS
jgi:DNA-binding response OmpR family regulator